MLLRYARRLMLLTLAVVFFSNSAHSVTYTYQTNFFNPLHDITQPSSPPDFFGLKFDVPFTLLANSVYSISVGPAPNVITSWSAQDSLFGIQLAGTSATITRFTGPSGIDGAPTLVSCNNPCLGGAVATDGSGNINQWNLVAFPTAGPYLLFLTYNTPALGSIDGLGLTQNGLQQLQLNQLNGEVGFWQARGSPTEPTPVPVPNVGAGLPGLLMAIAGFIGWRRRLRAS